MYLLSRLRLVSRGLAILGAGGQARETADLAELNGYRVDVFLNESARSAIMGVPVLEELAHRGRYRRLALGVGSPALRHRFFRRECVGTVPSWPVLRHPAAVISRLASVAEGVFVQANASVNVGAALRRGVLVNYNVTVGHGADIGEFSVLLPGAAISGDVALGTCVTIGSGAVVLPGLRVGDNSVVGAGAVVLNDVPRNSTVVGVPARARDTRE